MAVPYGLAAPHSYITRRRRARCHGLGVPPGFCGHPGARSLVRRDMFQVPHVCRWILLVFPSSLAQVQGLTLSDQRMAIAMAGVWTIALSVTFGIGAVH